MSKKTALILLFTLLTTSFNLHAEHPAKAIHHVYTSYITLGIKGGLVQSALPPFQEDDAEGHLTPFGGLFFNTRTIDCISLALEFLYVPSYNTNYKTDASELMSYLQVPLIFKLHLSQKWSFDMGAELNLLLSSHHKGYRTTWTGVNEYYDENNYDTQSSYGSMCLGFSYHPRLHYIISARGSFGFSSIEDSYGDWDLDNRNILRVSVGYIL